ncbi:VOC family protein [Peredibacter starrii]|uniref:VOC family protein n=1 Tax=Peredibacter starrii TaxID=28202 RepID=A0AAX4HKX9_9BACT|nr:VOC family protein [Peredibacter starrii]WPU63927.1 VOC family protein [Peredibacter starrii]
MEPRISLITLGVSDLARSKKFYEALGFPTTWSEEKGVVFFKTSGTALSLFPLKELVKDIGDNREAKFPAFSGITIAHNTKEKHQVDEVMALVEKAGGKIVKKPQEVFWGGYSGYFTDPDGHMWEVAWGAFPFKADGSLDIP